MFRLGGGGSILTSLLCGKFNCVAGWTLEAIVGHNHEHLVFRVGHQVTKDAKCFDCGGVETFGLLLLTDHQTWNLARLSPVV